MSFSGILNIRKSASLAIVLSLLALANLSACDYVSNQLKFDRGRNLDAQDFKDGLASRVEDLDEDEQSRSADADIPSFKPYMSGMTDNMKPMPLVSIQVNQSVPLRDVLFELAKQADYDLELDPRIRGSIIYTARNKPFDVVVENIADLAGLRYRFKDDVLRVELDMPYRKLYKVDYLSYIRNSSSAIRSSVGVVTGDGAETGSEFEATSESTSDFWAELQSNMDQIIGARESNRRITSSDPRITAADQSPDVQSVAPRTDENGNVVVSPPRAVLNVESLPVDEQGGQAGRGGQVDAENDPFLPRYSVNKQAGIINVYASERIHKEVEEYLNLLKRATTSQVLIEAKILEVQLSDEFSTGIDWRALGVSPEITAQYLGSGAGALDTFRSSVANASNAYIAPTGTNIATDSNFVLGYSGNDIEAVAEAISGFGSVRALASPRLTVLNNQSAVLNVADNVVYFEVNIDVTTDEGVTQEDISSETHNVPEGVLVNVQPSIDLDNNTIQMALRPTITRIIGYKADPAVQYVTAQNNITGVESLIPEVNVQEIDSVIQVKSGQAIIMGGLLQDRATSTEEGIPGLMEVPLIGSAFKKHTDLIEKTELVILLKATIIEPNGASTIHSTDKDIYRKFSGDRRPFKL